ncbi:metal ABC transporter permease, partial [Escherichia coli]|nr:metal ABC transporter permease [Escherichia coli]
VIDGPDVQDLASCSGHLKWNNVGFSYDKRRPALHDLSFECKPGTTTAFLSHSGNHNSTFFRLIFRYSNFQEGSIQMD